jgi:hypothetical protein
MEALNPIGQNTPFDDPSMQKYRTMGDLAVGNLAVSRITG